MFNTAQHTRWKLTKGLAAAMMALYGVYLFQAIYRAYYVDI